MRAMANERSCLPCSACSQGWLEVSEGDVRASLGHGCEHCSSSGCGIYDQRPLDPCRSFLCAWRQEGTALPHHLRPDLSGCIVVMDRLKWRDQNVIVGIPVGAAVPDKMVQWLAGLAKLTGLNLLLLEFDQSGQQFLGTSRVKLLGQEDFKAEMAERFKDGQLKW